MSRSVRDPDYAHPTVTLHQCYECATLTTNPVNIYGVVLCERHA